MVILFVASLIMFGAVTFRLQSEQAHVVVRVRSNKEAGK